MLTAYHHSAHNSKIRLVVHIGTFKIRIFFQFYPLNSPKLKNRSCVFGPFLNIVFPVRVKLSFRKFLTANSESTYKKHFG